MKPKQLYLTFYEFETDYNATQEEEKIQTSKMIENAMHNDTNLAILIMTASTLYMKKHPEFIPTTIEKLNRL